MSAVDDRLALAVQERAGVEQVERVGEQGRMPAVQEITRDHEVVAAAGDDAVELTCEPGRIVAVVQMKV